MGDVITVHEVGLRDGLQNQPRVVPTEGKLRLLDALLDAGLRSVEAASFVSPKAVPQMADAADVYARLPQDRGAGYEALVPNEKGYERAVEAGVTTVALVLAATDAFNRRNINMSLDEAIRVNEAVIRRAKADGIRARSYLSVVAACPYEGIVPPETVFDLAARMFDAGADELALGDSTAPAPRCRWPISSRPSPGATGLSASPATSTTRRAMGLTLTWVAIECGIRKFDSSIGGLGGCPFAPGATGNLATEDLVFMVTEAGFETGIDVGGLRCAVAIAEELTGQTLGGRITPYLDSQEKRAKAH